MLRHTLLTAARICNNAITHFGQNFGSRGWSEPFGWGSQNPVAARAVDYNPLKTAARFSLACGRLQYCPQKAAARFSPPRVAQHIKAFIFSAIMRMITFVILTFLTFIILWILMGITITTAMTTSTAVVECVTGTSNIILTILVCLTFPFVTSIQLDTV